MEDTFWITLPVETWQTLFRRSIDADCEVSDLLCMLIERGELAPDPTSNLATQLEAR
jgi:hypothetical protein